MVKERKIKGGYILIYAVDFDGTLCESNWPDIGEPNWELIEWIITKRKNEGAKFILWTMREGQALEEALGWCLSKGLWFDAVNDNIREQQEMYHNNPRKVYADFYIDDHNIGGLRMEDIV